MKKLTVVPCVIGEDTSREKGEEESGLDDVAVHDTMMERIHLKNGQDS